MSSESPLDRNGVFWASLASGHLASFDRRMCKGQLNGPNATGKHCPEGWTLHRLPGPQFKDVPDDGSAEASYYTWVDQHNTSGLGENIPMSTANLNDGFVALKDGNIVGFVIFRSALRNDVEVEPDAVSTIWEAVGSDFDWRGAGALVPIIRRKYAFQSSTLVVTMERTSRLNSRS